MGSYIVFVFDQNPSVRQYGQIVTWYLGTLRDDCPLLEIDSWDLATRLTRYRESSQHLIEVSVRYGSC